MSIQVPETWNKGDAYALLDWDERCTATEAGAQCIKATGHTSPHLWEDVATFLRGVSAEVARLVIDRELRRKGGGE